MIDTNIKIINPVDCQKSAVKIDLLKNHPETIPTLAALWHELLGKTWMPELSYDIIESLYYDELKQDMPLTYIALCDNRAVGSCTLQLTDEINPTLGPWLSDLVVDHQYQHQGIGTMLAKTVIAKTQQLGFNKLYLFAFDHRLTEYYGRLGWKEISMDVFKSHPVSIMELVISLNGDLNY